MAEQDVADVAVAAPWADENPSSRGPLVGFRHTSGLRVGVIEVSAAGPRQGSLRIPAAAPPPPPSSLHACACCCGGAGSLCASGPSTHPPACLPA